MAMSESYYHSNGFEPLYRSPNRPIATTAYYSRSGPYSHYEHRRHHTRQHYDDRQTVPDDEANNQGEQTARRRIAVACSRCRKRKIKCTGDPGDGSGCGACKSVGGCVQQECTFIRVKSEPMQIAQLEMLTHAAYTGVSDASNFFERERRGSERHQRSHHHIPVLHTRSTYAADLDSAAHNSPVDVYTYASSALPRQDSLNATYGARSLRSWSTACSAAISPTSTYCETYPTTTYASTPYPAAYQLGRLPSVSTESLSTLNMGHINSSLPSHGGQDRRLPLPYISQHPQTPFSQSESTRARPLGSFSTPRIPVNAIHTRHPLPWMLDTGATRAGSISSYSTPSSLSITTSQPMPVISGSALGYQCNTVGPSTSYGSYGSSPDISPTSAHPQSNSLDSSSNSSGSGETVQRYPMAALHYYPTSSAQHESPSHTATELSSSSQQRVMQNMYSFGTASSEQQSTLQEQEDNIIPSSSVTTYSLPVRNGRHSVDNDGQSYMDVNDNNGYQTALQHPRPLPQHSASIDNLCRQSPFEQHTPRSSTASRMSIRNFSGGYQ